jgi:hypothetical protein
MWRKQEDVYVIVHCFYGGLVPFCVMSFLGVAEIYKNGNLDIDVKKWFFFVILFFILIYLAKPRRCICHSTLFVWWIVTILCHVIFGCGRNFAKMEIWILMSKIGFFCDSFCHSYLFGENKKMYMS